VSIFVFWFVLDLSGHDELMMMIKTIHHTECLSTNVFSMSTKNLSTEKILLVGANCTLF